MTHVRLWAILKFSKNGRTEQKTAIEKKSSLFYAIFYVQRVGYLFMHASLIVLNEMKSTVLITDPFVFYSFSVFRNPKKIREFFARQI